MPLSLSSWPENITLTRHPKQTEKQVQYQHDPRALVGSKKRKGVYFAAKEMFVKLERAREVLLDREKRSKYDQWRSGGFKNIIGFEKWLEMHNRVHTVRSVRQEVKASLETWLCIL